MDELMLGGIEVRALAAAKAPARFDTLALLSDLHVTELVAEVRRLRREHDECVASHQRMNVAHEAMLDLLLAVQETFDGVDPVGVDLRNRITEFLDEPARPHSHWRS